MNATGYPRCGFDFDWDHRFIIFANLSDRVRRTLRDLLSVFVTTGDVEVWVDKGHVLGSLRNDDRNDNGNDNGNAINQ